jgi:hypothetical protein
MKKYEKFNNTCEDFENTKLCSKLKEKFDGGENGMFKSIEKQIDDGVLFYIAWIEPYSNTELFKGKVGMSESSGKEKWIALSTNLKDNDDAGWIEHEKGHIIGYSKGYDKKNGTTVDSDKVFGLDNYPNVWSEYYPFLKQMRYLKKNNLTPDIIIKNMMVDYEESSTHKGKTNELKQLEQFFIEFYKKNIDNTAIIENRYMNK